jgi:hypothetical protein
VGGEGLAKVSYWHLSALVWRLDALRIDILIIISYLSFQTCSKKLLQHSFAGVEMSEGKEVAASTRKGLGARMKRAWENDSEGIIAFLMVLASVVMYTLRSQTQGCTCKEVIQLPKPPCQQVSTPCMMTIQERLKTICRLWHLFAL